MYRRHYQSQIELERQRDSRDAETERLGLSISSKRDNWRFGNVPASSKVSPEITIRLMKTLIL